MQLRRAFRTVAVLGAVAMAVVQPAVPARSAPASRLRVVFDPPPADARAGDALTSVAFEPTGAPVVLKVLDGTKVANVKATFTVSVPGTSSAVAVTTESGVAPVSLVAPAPGQGYVLFADGDDVDGTSAPFDTYEQVQQCRNASGSTCVVDIDRPAEMHVTVSANTTTGALALNLGALPFGTCGVDGPADPDAERHAPAFVVQDESNIGVSKLAVMTIAREVVVQRADNGASFYEVCLTKDGVNFSNLPACPPARKRTTACVVSRTKTSAGDVQLVIFLPQGDPGWW
jgi:hypothetical protein